MDITTQLAIPWQNPSIVLLLLFVFGGDIVQHAIAQLFGVYSLASVLGDKRLMPSEPDWPSSVINCSSGYGRTNRSWILGRILRDYELAVEGSPGPEYSDLDATGNKVSLRIDIFQIQESEKPQIDQVWVLGWLTIVAQLEISVIPWIQNGDYGIFLITAYGSGVVGDGLVRATGRDALVAGSPCRALGVFVCCRLWAQQNTWFLVLIGGIGMIQNIYASVARRPVSAFNISIKPYSPRPSIVGLGFDVPNDDETSDEDLDDTTGQW
ncbi:hypothetical protein MKX08_003293 [Trichoderma sp. CBMAI-0020]|nr:hypothetical protein MKX08_003293 [Trichoderma sp. CBMAI-0020]